MVKNCKLVDNEDKKCIECIDCLYKEDKKRRPWVYEETLNGSPLFPFSNEESEEVEKEEVITLDNYF